MTSTTTPAVLPEEIRAVIFDMDGVITDTASVHAEAWKRLFDEFLRERADRTAEPFVPFDAGLTGFAKLVYSLGFGPGGALIAGTEDGVHLAAGGVTFSALNTGLERVPVWSIAVLPGSPAVVLAGTAQGVYWRTLP